MYGTREGWLTPPADAGLLLDKYLDSRAKMFSQEWDRNQFFSGETKQIETVLIIAKLGNEISDQDEGDEERR